MDLLRRFAAGHDLHRLAAKLDPETGLLPDEDLAKLSEISATLQKPEKDVIKSLRRIQRSQAQRSEDNAKKVTEAGGVIGDPDNAKKVTEAGGVIGDPESDTLHKCTTCNKIVGGEVSSYKKKRCPKIGGGCGTQKAVHPNNWIAMR